MHISQNPYFLTFMTFSVLYMVISVVKVSSGEKCYNIQLCIYLRFITIFAAYLFHYKTFKEVIHSYILTFLCYFAIFLFKKNMFLLQYFQCCSDLQHKKESIAAYF